MDDRRDADSGDTVTGRPPGSAAVPPSGSATDLRRLFVLQVIVWNAVLLLVGVGGLLIYFEADWTTGGQLLIGAAILGLYGLYRWPDREGGESSGG